MAQVRWDYPEDRQLGLDDVTTNSRKLDAVCGLSAGRYDASGALVATGGICLPVNVDYSVPTWATADRPLRDGLPAFQATRGGIRFVTPPDIGVPSLQVRPPEPATSAASGPRPPTPPRRGHEAGVARGVRVRAVRLCERHTDAGPVREHGGRFAPEQVAANTQQAIAVSAREAELELLTLMYNSSKQVVPAQYLGATRDMFASVDLLIDSTATRTGSRRPPLSPPCSPSGPRGVPCRPRPGSRARQRRSDRTCCRITDAQIEDWFAARGINVIWTIDGLKAGTYGTGGQAITNQFFRSSGRRAPPRQWPGHRPGHGVHPLVAALPRRDLPVPRRRPARPRRGPGLAARRHQRLRVLRGSLRVGRLPWARGLPGPVDAQAHRRHGRHGGGHVVCRIAISGRGRSRLLARRGRLRFGSTEGTRP